jgi:hypothetical protein
MHFRRLVCFLLGAWLAGGLFMAAVATQNFRSVDRVLYNPAPAASQEIKAMGPDMARAFLRYLVSEQNRWYFERWEGIQIGIALLTFFLLLFGSTESKVSLGLALLMLLIVAAQRFLLTPMIISFGRVIDFVPDAVHSPERTRFWVLHHAYSGMEVGKWCLCLLLTLKLVLRSRRRSSHVAGDIDVVDKPYYRHVDR